MNINNNIKSRKRNRNNNSNLPASKRFKASKRRVTFKNKHNVKNVDMAPNAVQYRKSLGKTKNFSENLPNYMKNRSIAQQKANIISQHKKFILKK